MFDKKIGLVIFIVLLSLSIRFLFSFLSAKNYHDGKAVIIDTLLLSDIDNYNKKSSLYLPLPDSFPSQRVNIVFPAGSGVHYGQHLHIVGNLNYTVLNNGNTAISIYFPKYTIVPNMTDSLFSPLYALRKQIVQGYQLSLSDIDSSLLLGIVFGVKETMPKAFSQQVQATGVTHVIAASGMNVTMVAGFLIALFGKLFTRKTAIVLSLLGLFLYALFAGLQPSILRATIMGVCLFSSQLFGKQYRGFYILFLTGCFMLFFSPILLFDVGFQLSFMSTLGILVIQPLFKGVHLLTDDLATTISAQIATVPIMIATFGQYSWFSVIVNGLVLWTIPPLMLIGSMAAFVGLLFPFAEKLLLYIAIPFLWFFETIISFFASLPILLVFSTKSIFLIIGYYFVVAAVISCLYARKNIVKDSIAPPHLNLPAGRQDPLPQGEETV